MRGPSTGKPVHDRGQVAQADGQGTQKSPDDTKPIVLPAEPIVRRGYANSTKDVLLAIRRFAEWVATTRNDLDAYRAVVFHELPQWYMQTLSSFASGQAAQPRVLGGSDVWSVISSLVGTTQAAAPVAAALLPRVWPSKNRAALEAADAAAGLTVALAAELTQAAGRPIRITSPELLGPARVRDELALVVYASLSSILWRSKPSRGSLRVLGGWLVVDGAGAVRSADLYAG